MRLVNRVSCALPLLAAASVGPGGPASRLAAAQASVLPALTASLEPRGLDRERPPPQGRRRGSVPPGPHQELSSQESLRIQSTHPRFTSGASASAATCWAWATTDSTSSRSPCPRPSTTAR